MLRERERVHILFAVFLCVQFVRWVTLVVVFFSLVVLILDSKE